MATINPVNKSICLEQVCTSNYQKLLRLIPELSALETATIGYSSCKPALYLEILDKSPYTITLRLSHYFANKTNGLFEPDVKIRVYLDAQLVEVLRDHARSNVSSVIKNPGQSEDILNYKWSLNYFLSKWLDHCIQTEYLFESAELLTTEMDEVQEASG
jgi:uncharacterized protein